MAILKNNNLVLATSILSLIILLVLHQIINNESSKLNYNRLFPLRNYELISRDFFRYECNNIQRIGGLDHRLLMYPNKLSRVDGAWFVCFDKGLSPVQDKCNIISFGINTDESFDRDMNTNYGCRVESFDPYIENKVFRAIRNKDDSLRNRVTLGVNKKWRFHRIGVVGNNSIQNVNKIGWLTTFKEILKYTKLEHQIIDVLKMDIENGEWDVLKEIDMDYLCKYVKQFMMETHIKNNQITAGTSKMFFNQLKVLEKCFLLFRRDTRFYQERIFLNQMLKTEFQSPRTYKIDLNQFMDENDIIDFMVTYGELYFINENFIQS
jgi:hypothetical protein